MKALLIVSLGLLMLISNISAQCDTINLVFKIIKIDSSDSLYHQIYLENDSLALKAISKKRNITENCNKEKIVVDSFYWFSLYTALQIEGIVFFSTDDNVSVFNGIEIEPKYGRNLFYIKDLKDLCLPKKYKIK